MTSSRNKSSAKRFYKHALAHSLTVFPLVLGLGFFQASEATPDIYWFRANGKNIGTVSIESFIQKSTGVQNPAAASDEIVTVVENKNRMNRLGNDFTSGSKSRFVEKITDGTPVQFTHSYHLSDQPTSESKGQVEPGKIHLEVTQYDTQLSESTPIQEATFSFPTGEKIKRVFQAHYHDPVGSQFQFQTLHLALAPHVVDSFAKVEAEETLTLPNGEKKKLRRYSLLPASETKIKSNAKEMRINPVLEWRDATGKLYKSVSASQGTELVLAPPDSTPLRQKIVGMKGLKSKTSSQNLLQPANQLDAISFTQIRANRLIPSPRILQEGNYKISFKKKQDGIGRDSGTPFLPVDDRQTILKTVDQSLYIRVTQTQPKDALQPYPIAFSDRYLLPNTYLQSTDPEIQKIAKQVSQGEPRAYYAAQRLQKWVNQYIDNKNLSQGFNSATETLASKQGDCTEHAVLLAAMARAIGIPSRVAVGVEYLPTGDTETGSFFFHMWTEVFIGKPGAKTPEGTWVPLDATNPEPWVDATHIKFADSDLSSPDAPVALSEQVIGMMGQLKIDVLESHNKATTEISLGMGNIAIPTPIKPVDIEAIEIKGKSRGAIKQFRTVSPQEVARENTLDGYLDQGIQALSEDQYPQAMALFQKAANEAKTPMAQFALGERFYGLELYLLSQKAFQKASQGDATLAPLAQAWLQEFFPQQSLSSRQEEAYLKGVSSLLKSQNGDSAPMNAIIQESPRFYPALFHQAQELAQSGKIKEALGVYQQLQQVAPQDPRGLQGVGECYLSLKKFTQATQAFQQAIVLAKALKSPPGRNLLKDLYTQQAVAQGRLACAKNPGSISAWLSIGKGLMEQRRPFEALSAFKKAVALSPPRYPSPEALAYQIKIYLGNNDWEGAQSYYQRLKGHAGNVPFAYTALGYYEMRMRQYPQAIQHLKEALRLNPQSAQSYGHLAEVYLRLKEPRNAQKVLEQGLLASQGKSSSPSSLTQEIIPEAFVPVAYDLAKLLYQSAPSQAEKLLLQLVAQDPLNGKAFQLLGQIALNSKDFTQAKTLLSKAFVLEPTDPSILATVGDLYRRLEDPNEAIYYLEKALKLAPASPEASRLLGLLIEEQGINREKPRLYLEITDDEKDYLTSLTLKVQRYLVNQNEQAQPVNGSGAGSEKTTVYDRKIAAYEQLGAFYDALLPQYEFLKRISPPERFVTLHAATLKTFYASLLSLNAGENAVVDSRPQVEGEEKIENPLLGATSSIFSQVSGEFNKLQSAIFYRLNPMTQKEILEVVHTVYPNATFGEASPPTANNPPPVSSQQPQPNALGNKLNPVTGPNPLGAAPTGDPNSSKKDTVFGTPPPQPFSPISK